MEQFWVPMGNLTQVFAMKLGFPYSFLICPTQILPGETGKTPHFFCIDFRRRWWCYYPPWWYFTDPQVEICSTIDVENQRKKTGHDIGKISVSIGNISWNGEVFPAGHLSFFGDAGGIEMFKSYATAVRNVWPRQKSCWKKRLLASWRDVRCWVQIGSPPKLKGLDSNKNAFRAYICLKPGASFS